MKGSHFETSEKRPLPTISAGLPGGVVIGLLPAVTVEEWADVPIRKFSDQVVSLDSPGGLYAHGHQHPHSRHSPSPV